MLQNATELCTLLIRDVYGDVSSRVVDALLEYGRSPLQYLVRRVKLPERIVRQTLVVLIQQHVVRHYTHSDGVKDTVYYECDWQQIYELLHAGKKIRTVEERFGPDAATVVSNFLLLGHARVSDFVSSYGVSTKPKILPQVNGTASAVKGMTNNPGATIDVSGTSRVSSTAAMKDILVKLVKQKFLVQVHEADMHPKEDTDNTLRDKYKAELAGAYATQIKLSKAVEEKLEAHKADLEAAGAGERAGLKRKSASSQDGRPKKRAKTSMYAENGDDEWEIDDKIVLRVNHEKFAVLYRDAELVSWVEQRIGKVTSQIYAVLLKKMEKHNFRCRGPDNFKKNICTTHDIAKALSPDISLEYTIGVPPRGDANGVKKRPYTNGAGENGDDDENDEDDADEDSADPDDDYAEDNVTLTNGSKEGNDEAVAAAKRKRLFQIKEHMRLLANDSMRFVSSEGSRGFGEWSIDCPRLAAALRTVEVEKIVEERSGAIATRLLRIVRDKGKLDEKQLASIALLKQKDIRAHLSSLHEKGHIQIQEVPKSNDRTPSRTLYLFYYDDERAQKTILHNVYKAMCRLIQRLTYERQCKSVVLNKAERTDVKGHEEEYLSKRELEEISRFRSIEEKLIAQLMRLDRQVMLFKDW